MTDGYSNKAQLTLALQQCHMRWFINSIAHVNQPPAPLLQYVGDVGAYDGDVGERHWDAVGLDSQPQWDPHASPEHYPQGNPTDCRRNYLRAFDVRSALLLLAPHQP